MRGEEDMDLKERREMGRQGFEWEEREERTRIRMRGEKGEGRRSEEDE